MVYIPDMALGPVISCFDLARHVGVATGRASGNPALETWIIDVKKSRPAKLVELDDRLIDHFSRHCVERVYYEHPLNIRTMMKIGSIEETIQMLRSYIAILEYRCERENIPTDSWDVQSARQTVIGQGRFKKGQAKAGVMRGLQWLKYDPKTNDEADALVGFLYESSRINPYFGLKLTPMFRDQA